MGILKQNYVSEPSTPDNGEGKIYLDQVTKKLASKDDEGNVTNYAEGGSGGTDELAKVSANDTTAGYLESKIVAGANVTITTLNDGANETLQIEASGGGGVPANVFSYEWIWNGADSFFNSTPFSFKPSVSGSGANILGGQISQESRVAQLNVTGGSTANSVAILYTALNSSSSGQFLPRAYEYIYEYSFFFDRLGLAGTDRGEQIQGFANSRAAGYPSHGCLISYEPNESTELLLKNGLSGTYDTVPTGIVVAADTVYKAKQRIVDLAGIYTHEVYINDVLVASSSTRMPTDYLGIIHKSRSVDAGATRTLSLVGRAKFTIIGATL